MWRRDGKDIKIIHSVIDAEKKRLQNTALCLTRAEINRALEIFSQGVWEGYKGMIDLITDEMTPEVLIEKYSIE